ncbi:MAG TPA: preprotein translocase subunit SecG [Pyrinomonadaceae bacterium]|nr:preprotein translocase subunit SecG [Acidobacteriota bacterium]HQZ95179.1 preprotein translocase subunit SecG [Pyrinomonadaceae bacterium]
MVYILYAIFFLSCIVLVASVLLQPGKTDAGALFTSNVSSSALAPRGTATVLSKITIIAASTFMLSALFLAMPALTGNVSVLSSNPETPAEAPASSVDANANTAPADANANTAPVADTNSNANSAPSANVPAANAPAANANSNTNSAPAGGKATAVLPPAKPAANK